MEDVKKYDILDNKYKLKKFYKLLYRGIGTNEYIRVFQCNKPSNDEEVKTRVSFFDDIDELVDHSTNKIFTWNNMYFELSTTDGESGTEEHLKYRYFLGFDFDKKPGEDFDHKDILNKFRENKLYYHALVDSGHGYHVYICINKTDKLKMVQEVQVALADKLKADLNAIKSTQLLRIPYTNNIKDEKPHKVKLVTCDDRHGKLFRPYDIEFLYRKNCDTGESSSKDKQINYTLKNTSVPKCIEEILLNGSEEGRRYEDLQRIVIILRQRNKALGEILEVCKDWAHKSEYKENLDYQVDSIYKNLNHVSMNCSNCSHKQECYSAIISDFSYAEDDVLLTMNETHMSKLKHTTRRNAKVMKANDLLVYGILKCHEDGLTREEILNELTYTKKKKIKNIALSDRTLKDTLKSLEDNDFVICILGNARAGVKNSYKLKECTNKVELVYNISYAATYECVKGNISVEELRLYNYMRCLHHKTQREDPRSLKGNLFQFNQKDLAKDLGLTQGRVSQMINNLLDEKVLGIWYRQQSKSQGFDYNIYRLVY